MKKTITHICMIVGLSLGIGGSQVSAEPDCVTACIDQFEACAQSPGFCRNQYLNCVYACRS